MLISGSVYGRGFCRFDASSKTVLACGDGDGGDGDDGQCV